MASPLAVYMGGQLAAWITPDRGGGGSLSYDSGYIASADAVPLSLALPMNVGKHTPDAVNKWISGLLPDNPRVLERWYANEGISPPTPLGLLATSVGRDCAGAVQFAPNGSEDAVLRRGYGLRKMSPDELSQGVMQMASDLSYWLPDDEEAYFCLGGYQAKTALHRLEDGTWARPTGMTPTTHILKPSPITQTEMAVVEHVCLDTARRLGANAAKSTLEVYGGIKVCVIQRYDRQRDENGWHRIHQEDMCQSLGYHPYAKYEALGGPGIMAVGDLIRKNSTSPREDLESFRDAIIYYWLIVNRDAHAKNYSVLLQPGRVRLAPIYDPGSVLPGGRKRIGSYETAMRFGSDFTVYRSHAKDSLSTLSAYLNVRHEGTMSKVEEMAGKIEDCAEAAINALPVEHQTQPLERMLQRLKKRSEDCLKTASGARSLVGTRKGSAKPSQQSDSKKRPSGKCNAPTAAGQCQNPHPGPGGRCAGGHKH